MTERRRNSPRPGRAGRPVIALDLGGTKLAIGLVDAEANIERVETQPTEPSGGEACLEQLVEAAQTAQQWARGRAEVVGISIPGLARKDGTVWAPNIRGWEAAPVADYIGNRAAISDIVVESDRNASVLGEAWAGVARGARDAIYLIVGTGIGAGIISGGELVRGATELSGCAGWLVSMDCDGRMRPLEELSAGPAIGRAGAKALGVREASAQQVFELAATGNTAAQAVIENAAQNLGIAVANLISLFNPEVVVLGGGVGTAGPALLEPLRATALRYAQPLAAKTVRIEASTLGANAPLLGAAYLALNIRRSAECGEPPKPVFIWR